MNLMPIFRLFLCVALGGTVYPCFAMDTVTIEDAPDEAPEAYDWATGDIELYQAITSDTLEPLKEFFDRAQKDPSLTPWYNEFTNRSENFFEVDLEKDRNGSTYKLADVLLEEDLSNPIFTAPSHELGGISAPRAELIYKYLNLDGKRHAKNVLTNYLRQHHLLPEAHAPQPSTDLSNNNPGPEAPTTEPAIPISPAVAHPASKKFSLTPHAQLLGGAAVIVIIVVGGKLLHDWYHKAPAEDQEKEPAND